MVFHSPGPVVDFYLKFKIKNFDEKSSVAPGTTAIAKQKLMLSFAGPFAKPYVVGFCFLAEITELVFFFQ